VVPLTRSYRKTFWESYLHPEQLWSGTTSSAVLVKATLLPSALITGAADSPLAGVEGDPTRWLTREVIPVTRSKR
jgi:hypothetical protein